MRTRGIKKDEVGAGGGSRPCWSSEPRGCWVVSEGSGTPCGVSRHSPSEILTACRLLLARREWVPLSRVGTFLALARPHPTSTTDKCLTALCGCAGKDQALSWRWSVCFLCAPAGSLRGSERRVALRRCPPAHSSERPEECARSRGGQSAHVARPGGDPGARALRVPRMPPAPEFRSFGNCSRSQAASW